MTLSRRSFLGMSAAAGLGLPLTRLAGRAEAASAPASPICVFTKHLQWMDYDALAETCAEAGFEGLDLTVRPGGHVVPERVRQDLPRAVAAARRAGLQVPMMVTAIMDAREPHAESILGTASELGITHYRMGWMPYPNPEDVAGSLEALRPRMRELAEMNARYGLHGAYQNHAGTRVGGPVWDVALLLRDLDPRWIGCQYDIRHATVEGGTSWPLGLRLLDPYIQTTALKDFHWERSGDRWRIRNVPIGEGMVDFPAYFKLIRELDVRGPVTVHYEYAPLEGPNDLPPAARRKQAIELMRADLQRIRSLRASAGL